MEVCSEESSGRMASASDLLWPMGDGDGEGGPDTRHSGVVSLGSLRHAVVEGGPL